MVIVCAILNYSAAKFEGKFTVKLLQRFWPYHARRISTNPLLYLPSSDLVDGLTMPSDETFAKYLRDWQNLKAQLTPAETDVYQKLAILFAGGKGVSMATWQGDCFQVTKDKLFNSLIKAKLISKEDVITLGLRSCYVSAITDMGARYAIGYDLYLHKPTAEDIAKTFRRAFEEYGIPLSLRFDNGGEFKNKLMEKISTKLRIEVKYNKPDSPQQNCVVENFNGGIQSIWVKHIWEDYLSKWHKYNGNLSVSLLRESLAKAKNTRNSKKFYRSAQTPSDFFANFPSQKVRDLEPGEADRLFFTAKRVGVRSGCIKYENKKHYNSKLISHKKCIVYREITTNLNDKYFAVTIGGQILCRLRMP